MSASPEETRLLVLSASGTTVPIPKKSQQIRTDKPRPHLCSICTRGFARLEHLKRHERAHTNEKPYQCAACGRCFARRDLVLRHQQKLHLKIFLVARRSLLPATLSQAEADSIAGSPNENVIILRNNTRAKAPLPDLLNFFAMNGHRLLFQDLDESSPLNESPTTGSVPSRARKNEGPGGPITLVSLAKQGGTIPSPNTNSYQNTPSLTGTNNGESSSFSDLDMLQSHNIPMTDYTQQPSPLTGDSPADQMEPLKLLKEKQRQDFLNDQLEFKSSLDLKNLSNFHKAHQTSHRHASFSAVSGLSYTNLQDALAIRSTHAPRTPSNMGFTTPQMNSSDVDFADLQGTHMNGIDLDWANFNFPEPLRDASVHGENVSTSLGKQKNANGFKMSLNTIPSESHLANAFLGDHSPNHVLATHQFQNPEHPHHIPGSTPLGFDFSNYKEPHSEVPGMGYGTGITQLTHDIALLQEHEAMKQQESHDRHAFVEPDSKRRKLGFVNDIDDLTWLEQFKDIPLSNDLPLASKDTGFVGMPFMKDEFKSDEVFSLFKMKQDDLVKQKSQIDLNTLKSSTAAEARPSPVSRKSPRAQFTIGEPNEFITDDLRAKIIETSNVADDHFPSKEDLNEYMILYGEEFNKYFLFIHLPTLKNPMVDNHENIPMILAMCAIGALYSYHDSNTLLLFNLSKFHIHRFFENEVTPNKLQLKKVPIMAHQCLVLHIFISMFLNEPNMVEITSKQMNSMVGLIRSTNFHRPLEQFLRPPPQMTNANDQANLQNNHGYFIMAQTRIRTILTFYELEVIRSILLGCPLPLGGSEIKSGIHCRDERLWRAEDSSEWFGYLSNQSDLSIVNLSNNKSLQELSNQLRSTEVTDEKCSLDKALVLLMYVHEQILASYALHSGKFDPFTWRLDCLPRLKYLILSWEEFFVRSGGSVIINNQNQKILNSNSDLKLILPLLWLAKMRVSVNFSPVTASLLSRDWNAMKHFIMELANDTEGLKEASGYALDVLQLWIHNISVVNDAKQTSVRTPVFFLTAVFISVMILGKTIEVIENAKSLSVSERALWLKCEQMFRKIETTLCSVDQSSYSEYLNKQSGGVFNFGDSEAFHKNVAALRLNDKAVKMKQLKQCKLLTRVLGLGVRILADAPLWPLAMRFAEALKYMAVEINAS